MGSKQKQYSFRKKCQPIVISLCSSTLVQGNLIGLEGKAPDLRLKNVFYLFFEENICFDDQ